MYTPRSILCVSSTYRYGLICSVYCLSDLWFLKCLWVLNIKGQSGQLLRENWAIKCHKTKCPCMSWVGHKYTCLPWFQLWTECPCWLMGAISCLNWAPGESYSWLWSSVFIRGVYRFAMRTSGARNVAPQEGLGKAGRDGVDWSNRWVDVLGVTLWYSKWDVNGNRWTTNLQ